MQLLVGLGNPGEKYARNRHNVGFHVIDAIAANHPGVVFLKKFQGELAELNIEGEKILLLKPQTFMNRSGQSVGQVMRFYKLTPEQVTVFHDELDLPPAKLRIKRGGGHGGHNGLRDVDNHIGKDYRRVRIGIGHPGHKDAVSGYVLHDFAKDEKQVIDEQISSLVDALSLLLEGKDAEVMSRLAMKAT